MPPTSTLWEFATSPWFQVLAFSVAAVGTILGVIAWRQARATNRINQFLFQQAEKNIDKNLTEEELREKRSEVTQISEQITALRNRIEVEIPIEAKRTVLRDRLDGNIKNLHQTLNATLDIKRQLETLGTSADIPPDLLKAVKAEILPEYIETAQHEQLKSYLIILLVVSAMTSAVALGDLALIIQVPLPSVATQNRP